MADTLHLELSILAEESMAKACRAKLAEQPRSRYAENIKRLAQHCECAGARLRQTRDEVNG